VQEASAIAGGQLELGRGRATVEYIVDHTASGNGERRLGRNKFVLRVSWVLATLGIIGQ
jgi:hypothetical protein